MLQNGIMNIDDDTARLAITMMLSASPTSPTECEAVESVSTAFLELDIGMAYEKGNFSAPVLLNYTVSPNWTVKLAPALKVGAENASFLVQWSPAEAACETAVTLGNWRVAADIAIAALNDADTSIVKSSTICNVSNLFFNPAETWSPFAVIALSFNESAPADQKLIFTAGFDFSSPHSVQIGFGVLPR